TEALPESRERAVLPASSTEPTRAAAIARDSRTIRILVVDQDGAQPLEGVLVQTLEDSIPAFARTDDHGVCSIQLSAATEQYGLTLEREGYSHVHGFYYASNPTLTLQMRRTATLSGRVVDKQTRMPISGAELSLVHSACPDCEPLPSISNSTGEYELRDVPSGRSIIRIGAEGYPKSFVFFDMSAQSGNTAHDFEIDRGVELRGQVTDFTTGIALGGAVILCDVEKLISDGDGRFAGRGVPQPDGSLSLEVSAPGYCTMTVHCTREEAAAQEWLALRLPRATIVEVRVRDSSGVAIEGARVAVEVDPFTSSTRRMQASRMPASLADLPSNRIFREPGSARGFSGAGGRFVADGLLPWSEIFRVAAEHPGFEPASIPLEHLGAPGETTHVDVVLHRGEPEIGCKARGRVRLNGATAAFVCAWSGSGREGRASFPAGSSYALAGLPVGELTLRIELVDVPATPADNFFTANVGAGQELVHDFDLTVPTVAITGMVRTSDGAPAAAARVLALTLSTAGSVPRWVAVCASVRCSPDGAFELPVPEVMGAVRLHAMLGPASSDRDGVVPGTHDVILEIPCAGTLRIRVLDAQSRVPIDVDRLKIVLRNVGEAEYAKVRVPFEVADQDGWQSTRVVAGRTEVRIQAADLGYVSAFAVADVPPSGDARLEFALEPGLRVAFQLETKFGAAWTNHEIYVLEPESWDGVQWTLDDRGGHLEGGAGFPLDSISERRLSFDEGGLARLKCLAAGRYRFKVVPNDVTLEPESIDLTGDTTEPIAIRWSQ
ncbi:MAG: hypothetical protein ABI054_05960, partial [Planctomycetota bacterium]